MPHRSDNQPTVRIQGRLRPYLERRRIRDSVYYLLRPIGSSLRNRYLAFAPSAGPGGSLVQFQDWDDEPGASQFLAVLQRLKDDGFPRVLNYQRTSEGFVCVLSWIEGICLTDYLANISDGLRPPMDAVEAIRLTYSLSCSLVRLSRKVGVIHGDIQPANLVQTQNPARLIPIDFGNAWDIQRANDRENGDGRSMIYAAPEQWDQSMRVDSRADMFSVAVILFQLLTEQIPYEGLGGKAGWPQYRPFMTDRLERPSDLAQSCQCLPRSLRKQLDEFVIRGLQFDPGQRFRDLRHWIHEYRLLLEAFQAAPTLPISVRMLTQVIDWLAGRFSAGRSCSR